MKTIKVSVIVPVYNVEEYIEECIESIINQTLKEIEIIIVNDGTKDNSMKRIEKYLSDSRIIVINKENGGASSARNAGLKIAKGEYVIFIDSDDFIDAKMLEELYNESKEFEIVTSDLILFDFKINKKSFFLPSNFRLEIEKNNIKKGSYIYPEIGFVACGKLYKKNFLEENNLLFKEGIIHEDELFSLQSCFLAKKIKIVKKQYYYYRINREGSVMNTLKKEKRSFAYKTIADEIKKFRKAFNGTEFEKFRLYLCERYYEGFAASLKNKKISEEKVNEFEEKIKETWRKNYFSEFEKNILREDIRKVIKYKQYFHINFLDSFYWKNKLLTKKIFRRAIEGKIKNIIQGEFIKK